MAELTKRVQILLSEQEYEFLKGLSAQKRRSVGDLVRDAVSKVYRPSLSLDKKWLLRELEQEGPLAVRNLDDARRLLE